MITGIAKVRLGVQDQEMARRVWVEHLGATVVQDEAYGDERWLEVKLPDGVRVVLEPGETFDPDASAGQPNVALFLACDDVRRTHDELSRRGVAFAQEPVEMPFGWWALVDDGQGNRIPLVAAG